MRIKNTILVFLLGIFVLMPGLVFAQWDSGLGNIQGIQQKNTQLSTSLQTNIASIIRTVLIFSAVIFLVLTVYAGFLWMMASGNEDKVDKAKRILMTTIIGLVVVFFAYTITAVFTAVIQGREVGSSAQTDQTE